MKKISNAEIAGILRAMGEYLAMQGVAFKPRAYEKAAETVASLGETLTALYEKDGRKAIEAVPGVGTSIAGTIEELLTTGKSKHYEELKSKTPVNLEELSRVEGLGPKKIKLLYEKLGIKSLNDLEKAAHTGKIGNLEGFGKKSEENILKGISFAKQLGGRFLLGAVMPEVRLYEKRLRAIRGVENLTIAGSIRRWSETVHDMDILIISDHPKPIMDFFVRMPEVVQVHAHGETKSSVKVKSGIDVDLRVVPRASHGAALNYFTGSKDHNVALREIAVKKGLKLNEYGLYRGAKMVAGKSEDELYRALGMDYIEPEMRENTGEIELAKRHALPKLIDYKDLVGDLQVQTDWTDGAASIEEMAKAAIVRGLQYIAITDHTKRLAMTHGLDEVRIQKQWLEIDRLNKKYKGKLAVLKGTECDILKDGTLDLPDAILAKLDVVGVSVHSFFSLPRADQTKRVIRALENPHVDILFHPTGRLIQKRPAYDIDIDAVIEAAKKTKTVLEIDAFPDRLDLRDEHIKKAISEGVKLAIDSDAHHPSHFEVLEYGIAQARRGWATKEDVINAWSIKKMQGFLK